MKVEYTKRFLKDLSKISFKKRKVIEQLVFEKLPKVELLRTVPNVKKLSIDPFYRIRVGDYRIGLEKHGDHIVLKRVLNRNEIYKYFP